MRIRFLLALSALALLSGCPSPSSSTSSPSPNSPTSTPAPLPKSQLRVDSFFVVGKDGEKSESVTVRGGDKVNAEVEVSGFRNDGTDHSTGTVTLTIVDSENRSVQIDQPVPKEIGEPFVDGGKVSLKPSIVVGQSDPPGTFQLMVTVVDQTAQLEVGKSVKLTIEGPKVNAAMATPASGAKPGTPAVEQTSKNGEKVWVSPPELAMQLTSFIASTSESGPNVDPLELATGEKAYLRFEVAELSKSTQTDRAEFAVDTTLTRPDGTTEGPKRASYAKYPPGQSTGSATLLVQPSPSDPPGQYTMHIDLTNIVADETLSITYKYSVKAP